MWQRIKDIKDRYIIKLDDRYIISETATTHKACHGVKFESTCIEIEQKQSKVGCNQGPLQSRFKLSIMYHSIAINIFHIGASSNPEHKKWRGIEVAFEEWENWQEKQGP